MSDLHCARCGRLVAHVHDLRFGMRPTSALCLICSHPAFRRMMALG